MSYYALSYYLVQIAIPAPYKWKGVLSLKRKINLWVFVPFYAMVFLSVTILALLGSRAITVFTESTPLSDRHCIIIDAGHGGVDGGATSCSGVLESNINLEIALRLNDLLRFLGYDTKMVRTTDISVYTEGETIAAKKVSDLKERVRFVNTTPNALLISIHQNYYSDSRYSGAQVFYPVTEGSEQLAEKMQINIVSALNEGSRRQSKKASGIYLLEHIACTGVLVECGFLSNPIEEAKLLSGEYQKHLCGVIAVSISNYLNT